LEADLSNRSRQDAELRVSVIHAYFVRTTDDSVCDHYFRAAVVSQSDGAIDGLVGIEESIQHAVVDNSDSQVSHSGDSLDKRYEIRFGHSDREVTFFFRIDRQVSDAVHNSGIGEGSVVFGAGNDSSIEVRGAEADVAVGGQILSRQEVLRDSLRHQHPHIEAGIREQIIDMIVESHVLIRGQIVGEVLIELDLADQNAGAKSPHPIIQDAAKSPTGDGVVQSGLGVQV